MLRNMNDLWEDPEESARRGPWKCAASSIDNRSDRTDCRICMCPRDNLCLRCKKVNEAKARFCRFCGSPTAFSHYQVFDPEAKKERRETVFPLECEKAFELGRSLAERA